MSLIYFDTPSSGLISKGSYEKLRLFNEAMIDNSSGQADAFRVNEVPKLRQLIAEFSDAQADEFALIPNTSFGFNSVLASLKDRSRVLLYEKEYNGLSMSFDLRPEYEVFNFSDTDGFHWDIDQIKKQIIDQKIDLFVFSSVQWLSGYRTDVNDLCSFCKENGVLTIVDISQDIGSMQFSFSQFTGDIAITSNYKWLNAGFGSGIMWMKENFLEMYTPVIAGYNSAAPIFDFNNFQPTIRCYEPGHLNLHAFVLLSNSLKEKLTKGLDIIENHNKELTQSFISGATDLGYEMVGGNSKQRASIAILKVNRKIYDSLKNSDVMCRDRGEGIRFGFHHHNSKEDVQGVLKVLSDLRNS